jgi:hypothetical protein
MQKGYNGAHVGVWRSLQSGGRFYVGVSGRNLACRRQGILTFYLLKNKFYKCVLSLQFAKIMLQ